MALDLFASIDASTDPWKRDPQFPCDGFSEGKLQFWERADCDTDGHYLCKRCKFRNEDSLIELLCGPLCKHCGNPAKQCDCMPETDAQPGERSRA